MVIATACRTHAMRARAIVWVALLIVCVSTVTCCTVVPEPAPGTAWQATSRTLVLPPLLTADHPMFTWNAGEKRECRPEFAEARTLSVANVAQTTLDQVFDVEARRVHACGVDGRELNPL